MPRPGYVGPGSAASGPAGPRPTRDVAPVPLPAPGPVPSRLRCSGRQRPAPDAGTAPGHLLRPWCRPVGMKPGRLRDLRAGRAGRGSCGGGRGFGSIRRNIRCECCERMRTLVRAIMSDARGRAHLARVRDMIRLHAAAGGPPAAADDDDDDGPVGRQEPAGRAGQLPARGAGQAAIRPAAANRLPTCGACVCACVWVRACVRACVARARARARACACALRCAAQEVRAGSVVEGRDAPGAAGAGAAGGVAAAPPGGRPPDGPPPAAPARQFVSIHFYK